jgi:hypothetical protein
MPQKAPPSALAPTGFTAYLTLTCHLDCGPHRSVMKGDKILPLHLYQCLPRLLCTLLRVKS